MIEKKVLSNGLRLVFEKIPYVRSLSLGVWIGSGSRNESRSNNGISHFIEHMLFKGTKNRTAKEIAESIDSLGGQLNAFTGKECTCFYARVLDIHVDTAIDVLADMIFNSNLLECDIDLEKKVILEEINMYEDSPEDLVHDILSEITWENSTLGYPILGTSETVKKINRKMLIEYMTQSYVANNAVISVAGNFDADHLVNLIEKYFGNWTSGNNLTDFGRTRFLPNLKVKEKDIEQVHICMGLNAIEHGDDRLYALLVINNIFGGGMSSRLFQKIRENKGLVYSIYSYPTSFKGAGLFSIYAGMSPYKVKEVLELIMNEIKILREHGLTEEEMNRSKEQFKGNYILGLESTSSRMNAIGKSELILGKVYTPEEVLKKIDNVNADMVNEVINTVFTGNISLAVVGNIKKDIDFASIIKNC